MTEIDFIPGWYHDDRRRRTWYRQRYMMVLVMTGIWIVGNMIAGGVISRAHADLDSLRVSYEKGLSKIDQSKQLQNDLADLQRKSRFLQSLCPRTLPSAILAELAVRIGGGAVLKEITAVQVPFEQLDSSGKKNGAHVQLSSSGKHEAADPVPVSPTVWKVTCTGFARDGAEVATLIARLEESQYFTRVVPGFSRNSKWNDRNVTEFEISCIVADYVLTD